MSTAEDQAPWLEFLEENIAETDNIDIYNGGVDKPMKVFLLSGDRDLAKDTAHQINNYFWGTRIPWVLEPPETYYPNQEMAAYLGKVYFAIFELASLIPTNDPKHDMLLQLLFELRNLPPKSFTIKGKECIAYVNDPTLSESIEEVYSENCIGNAEAQFLGFNEKTSDFLNLTSFLATCFQAGIDSENPYRYKYLEIDLRESLERDSEPGEVRDFRLKVAANYILKAGRAIYEEFVLKDEETRRVKWGLWAERLKVFAKEYESDDVRAGLVDRMYGRMKEIDPSV